MADTDFMPRADFLRSGYEGLDTHDLLRSPLTVLIGIAPALALELRKLGIAIVFDLGSSWLFANACAASRAAGTASAAGRAGLAPNDWLQAATASVSPELISSLGIENLRGMEQVDVALLKDAMSLQTIRELALWPPYQYCRGLLSSSYGTEDPDDLSAEALRPRFGEYPTERVYYRRLVMLDMGLGNTQLKELDGPISLNKAIATAGAGQLQKPAIGALVTFSQSWYAQGVTLGHMLHSLALAPGECTRIAVIDWTRRTSASTTEMISESEALDSATEQGRSISEVQSATASDMQNGGSNSWANASSQSSSTAASVGTGLLTSLWASGDASGGMQQASSSTEAGSTSWSNGTRSVNGSMTQEVNDRTQQHSTSVRNRRASIVREVSQSEHEEVSTRIIANYNHMHALTVQYYEVVQIYRVTVKIHAAERCIFLPMAPVDFNDDVVIDRFRGVLLRRALNARVAGLLMDDATAVSVKGTLVADTRPSVANQIWKAMRPVATATVAASRIKATIAANPDAAAVAGRLNKDH